MKEVEKRIKINENRILIYNVLGGFTKPTYVISELFSLPSGTLAYTNPW